jgi:hypothetical protein
VLRLYALTLLRCEVPAMLEPVLAALLLDPAAAAAAGQNGQAQQGVQQNGLWSGVGSHNPLQGHSMPAALLALQQICSVTLQVRVGDTRYHAKIVSLIELCLCPGMPWSDSTFGCLQGTSVHATLATNMQASLDCVSAEVGA